MAIGTNDPIEKFGTQDDLASSSASVADGSFSIASDLAQWTNDDDAVIASIILESTISVTPTANSKVRLFARLMAFEGTNDQGIPEADFPHVHLGDFPIMTQTGIQRTAIEIGLPNVEASQVYEFYIQNNSGQTMSAGWTLFITPKSIGPSA